MGSYIYELFPNFSLLNRRVAINWPIKGRVKTSLLEGATVLFDFEESSDATRCS